MKLKLNADLANHRKGDVVDVKVDSSGVPLNQYWRNRLKDSELDNCVEVVKEAVKPKQQSKVK